MEPGQLACFIYLTYSFYSFNSNELYEVLNYESKLNSGLSQTWGCARGKLEKEVTWESRTCPLTSYQTQESGPTTTGATY